MSAARLTANRRAREQRRREQRDAECRRVLDKARASTCPHVVGLLAEYGRADAALAKATANHHQLREARFARLSKLVRGEIALAAQLDAERACLYAQIREQGLQEWRLQALCALREALTEAEAA